MIKEQITNESRLRSALLKWRSKLVPIDYLDRLKQIRKGCKIFKKGLKKIITIINPEIEKYLMKRCIDVWKSKLGDTQRMKNKIHLLFEDYVYSDRVHDGLFQKPKEDIVNLFRDYSDRKKEAADKIAQFARSINLIKRQKEKMMAVLKLNNILNNKERL